MVSPAVVQNRKDCSLDALKFARSSKCLEESWCLSLSPLSLSPLCAMSFNFKYWRAALRDSTHWTHSYKYCHRCSTNCGQTTLNRSASGRRNSCQARWMLDTNEKTHSEENTTASQLLTATVLWHGTVFVDADTSEAVQPMIWTKSFSHCTQSIFELLPLWECHWNLLHYLVAGSVNLRNQQVRFLILQYALRLAKQCSCFQKLLQPTESRSKETWWRAWSPSAIGRELEKSRPMPSSACNVQSPASQTLRDTDFKL